MTQRSAACLPRSVHAPSTSIVSLENPVSPGALTVGQVVQARVAKVEGDIDVAHVVINGTVAGPVRASEYAELLPKARVTGNVSYKSIEIHVGAIVMGQLAYESPQKSDKVIELKPHSGSSGNSD
jgi:cytoskeletal protein CcmA (bactofilin family)